MTKPIILEAGKLNLSVRRATANDCRLIFEWANDPVVRSNSVNPEPIEWRSHVPWFESRVDSQDCFFFVAESHGSPAGQVRFDRYDEHFVINFSIASTFRGQGLSGLMLESCITALEQQLNSQPSTECRPSRLHAIVKPANIASAKTFQRLNFEQITSSPEEANNYMVFERTMSLQRDRLS